MVMFCAWYWEKCTCWLMLDARSSRGNRQCWDLMEDSMDLLLLSLFFPFHLLLSFPFQLAGNLDVDAKIGAGNRF